MKLVKYIKVAEGDYVDSVGDNLYIGNDEMGFHTFINLNTLSHNKYESKKDSYNKDLTTIHLEKGGVLNVPSKGYFNHENKHGGVYIKYREHVNIKDIVYVVATYRVSDKCKIEIGDKESFGLMSDSFKVTTVFYKDGKYYGFVNIDKVHSFDTNTNNIVYDTDGDTYSNNIILRSYYEVKPFYVDGIFYYWVVKRKKNKIDIHDQNMSKIESISISDCEDVYLAGNTVVVVSKESNLIHSIEGDYISSVYNDKNILDISCNYTIIRKVYGVFIKNVVRYETTNLDRMHEYKLMYVDGECYLITYLREGDCAISLLNL